MTNLATTGGSVRGGGSSGKGRSAFAEQVQNEGPTGSDAAEFAANAKAQSEDYDNSVYLDSRLVAERNATKNLAPRSGARWVAVQNGDWSSTSTWYDTTDEDQTVPDVADANVLIPKGVTVTYDVTDGSEINLGFVRIDGTVNFDVTADRAWRVEYTFIDHTGRLQAGTAASPIPASVTVTFEPPGTGDMTVMGDMMKLSRGHICMDGQCEIHGASKVPFARATGDIAASATTVTLDQQVVGGSVGDWEVGDKLIITGTRSPSFDSDKFDDAFEGWENEDVTITGIDNTTPSAPVITFTPALSNAHPACHLNSALTAHVLNMTRNVKFSTPNGSATPIWQRPHNLFKGDGGVDVSWVETVAYGRTDHYEYIYSSGDYDELDYQKDSAGKYQAWDGPTFMNATQVELDAVPAESDHGAIVDSSSGASGRVSGLRDNGDGTATAILTELSGTFASGNTLTFKSGATADITEAPTTPTTTARTIFTGRYPMHFHRCGFDDPNSPALTFTGCVVDGAASWAYVHHDSHANIDKCIATRFRSAGIAAEGGGSLGTWSNNFLTGSLAPSSSTSISKAKDGGKIFGNYGCGTWSNSRVIKMTDCIASNVSNCFQWNSRTSFETDVYPGTLDESRIFYGLAETSDNQVGKAFAPIQQFEDCEGYCCMWGINVNKAQPNQHHDQRSIFTGYTGWEIKSGGVNWQYTAHYLLLTSKFYGREDGGGDAGIFFRRNAGDLVANQPYINNFTRGISFSDQRERLGHLSIEPTFVNVEIEHCTENGPEITVPWVKQTYVDSVKDMDYKDVADLGTSTAGSASFAWYEDEMIWSDAGRGMFALLGQITDSTGTFPRYKMTPELAGYPEVIEEQSWIINASKSTKSYGLLTLLDRTQMELLIQQEGVYTSTAGDKVLLIPDLWGDRSSGEITYFYTPVALRISTSYFNSLNPTDNGALADGVGEDYEGFDPAGTNGLT